MKLRSIITFICAALVIAALTVPSAQGGASTADYIVVLQEGSSPSAAAKRHGVSAKHLYKHALRGYSATLTAKKVRKINADPAVDYVVRDKAVSYSKPPTGNKTPPPPPAPTVQKVPTGFLRIDSPASRRDGVDDAVNVDVAVIDTGIDPGHSDLRYAGGYNCSTGASAADGNGHGTHVAGTIGAKDNTLGSVGIAPGARMWGIRVLNNAGSGTTSSVICGIDWVTAHSTTIEVANLSLGGGGSDDNNCGVTNKDPMHAAICRAVNAGVTFVVAAGNEGANAATSTPAAYDEVITVSAYSDFDGLAGALGTPTCRADEDDSFANFSNWGSDVDIAAPGVCIYSTWKGNSYNTISGTSMATPHVAGAAALYKAANPGADPAAVKAALQSHASTAAVADDKDSVWEGLLSVGGWL